MPLFPWNAYCAIWVITWDHFVSSFENTIKVEKSFLSSTDWLKVKVPDGFVVTLSLEFGIKQLQLISEFPGPPSLGLGHSPSPRCRSHTSLLPTLISQLGFHTQYWNNDQHKSGAQVWKVNVFLTSKLKPVLFQRKTTGFSDMRSGEC